MPRVANPFQIPDDLTKSLSVATKQMYTTKLNRLSQAGYNTPKLILEKQKEVAQLITTLSGADDEAARRTRRAYLSAIFWILGERKPMGEIQSYYDLFQKSKQNYVAPAATEEDWKDIPDLAPYQASRTGEIRRVWEHKTTPLKQVTLEKGYKRIVLSIGGAQKTFHVAVLVAKTFIPNPENKPQIDHIDNDPSNNRVENLRWATRMDQLKNRRPYSTTGEKHIHHRRSKNNGEERFAVAIREDGKMVFQKIYNTMEEARAARDAFLATVG